MLYLMLNLVFVFIVVFFVVLVISVGWVFDLKELVSSVVIFGFGVIFFIGVVFMFLVNVGIIDENIEKGKVNKVDFIFYWSVCSGIKMCFLLFWFVKSINCIYFIFIVSFVMSSYVKMCWDESC